MTVLKAMMHDGPCTCIPWQPPRSLTARLSLWHYQSRFEIRFTISGPGGMHAVMDQHNCTGLT